MEEDCSWRGLVNDGVFAVKLCVEVSDGVGVGLEVIDSVIVWLGCRS